MSLEHEWMGRDTLNNWVLNGRYFNFTQFVNILPLFITPFARLRGDLVGTVTLVPNEIEIHALSGVRCVLGRSESRTVNFEQFYELVTPSVQGCPISMVETAIRNSCIEFCEKSFIWKQESILNDVFEDEARYVFAPPSDAKVVTPYRVSINKKELQPTDLEELETTMPNWRELESQYPSMYFMDTDKSVILIGKPTVDIPLSLEAGVVLKPSRNARGCPSFIYQDWGETIAAGALARLLAMRGKIWAQESLAPYYDDLFKAGISRAKSKSSKSWQQSSKKMLPQRFYYF